MSKAGNRKMMKMRVETLPRDALDCLVMGVVDALYPGGDMEHDWSPDTLDSIAAVLEAHRVLSWTRDET